MKHKNAIALWNDCTQRFYEGGSQAKDLGIAALAKDVSLWASEVTDYSLVETKYYPVGNSTIATFLREWADAIERKGGETK
jgi:hypothetical protein